LGFAEAFAAEEAGSSGPMKKIASHLETIE
jgi:hypothetical protein